MTRLSEPVLPLMTSPHTSVDGVFVVRNGETDRYLPGRAAPSVASSVIAARLRWFRTERGLRLEDVAKRAGYTKGFLSKIEHGKALPPLATLIRVAAALGVEADVLFAPDAGVAPDASVHTVVGHGVPVRDDTAGAGRTLLALAANRHHKLMEPFVVTLEPGQISEERKLTCPGEEFIYILEGEVDYAIEDETHHLKAGDGLYFNATRSHAASAIGGVARFIRVFCASPARRQRPADAVE